MRIQVSHLRDYDFVNKLYNPIKKSDFWDRHDFILPHDGKDCKTNSRETLKNVDLLIAEVSFPSTGQGIELGFASVYDKPILCLYQKGQKIAGSLKYISNYIYEYLDADQMIEIIKRKINIL